MRQTQYHHDWPLEQLAFFSWLLNSSLAIFPKLLCNKAFCSLSTSCSLLSVFKSCLILLIFLFRLRTFCCKVLTCVDNFLIVFDGDIFGALYECSLTILFFTFEGDSFIEGSWISLFFGDLRLRVWCCKWDGWVGNSVGTAPSFSNLPFFPGLTMKQDSLKCTLHIKLWSFGNQCSWLTALAHCFKTGGFLCGKWKKEIFPPFSCLFVQPYTTQVPTMLDSKPK